MHCNIIRKSISKKEYHSMIETHDTAFSRTVKNGFSYYNATNLYTLGLREIRLENHTRFQDDYRMKIVINFNVFHQGDDFFSYNIENFVYDNFLSLLESTLEGFISNYHRGCPWFFEKVEYSRDYFTENHNEINNIMTKCNYINGKRKLEFHAYESGIEFCSYEKTDQSRRPTFRFHFYRKKTEQLDKKNHLTDAQIMNIENMYRIEAQLFKGRIDDLSRQLGVSRGSIEDFTNSVLEDNYLKKYIIEIYGINPHRKRKANVEIIKNSCESSYSKRQLIHILDQINQSSIHSARNKYKGAQKKLFDSNLKKIINLGINPINLTSQSPLAIMPPLVEQIF
ncbi:hypothetical protein [uncultured Acetobacterium sp.]|uniref:hypothetical protein n=1 Tax=uncultured Acetobacterium sp. TaxID=217139 RepID=UPI0025E91195|nr:hypothetical protein [uncultured Acetobacterium sp.]